MKTTATERKNPTGGQPAGAKHATEVLSNLSKSIGEIKQLSYIYAAIVFMTALAVIR